ncbi:MAG: hypothetical protein H0V66_10740, partial [Bdellovibrionales bacterium]|nr:hypothetical protein [Bdellovibrionales bacterium]
LRTSIEVENGQPFQKVWSESDPRFSPKLEIVRTDESKVLDLMRAETAVAFNKSEAPMFRAKLFQLGPSDYVFFFMVHHAVWDGWCFDIFFEELNVIYTALEKGMTPSFERNPDVSYLEYVLWLQKSLETGAFKNQLSYWQTKLKGPLPILEIPTDWKRSKTASHDGGNFRFALNTDQILELKQYAASKNSTVFNVLLTAYKLTLSHFSGLNDVIVGSPVRGRNTADLLQTIGYFVNTLALRTHMNMNMSFEENLKRVTTTCLEAFAAQDIQFELLLKNVDYTRDLSRTAIFQSFFTFQDMTNRQFDIDGRPVHQVSVNNASVKTDLDIWVKVTTKGIEGAIEYRADLFKDSTIAEFYKCFDFVINNLVQADMSKKVTLPTIERRQFGEEFNTKSETALLAPVNDKHLFAMKDIWKEVLDLSEIHHQDVFFDIGGNSLLAVKLFLEIEKKLQVQLNLSDLVQFPDLESFSKLLDKIPTSALTVPTLSLCLVPLRKTGTGSPVFFFHGVGGNVLNYFPLVKFIDQDRPIYALQSQGIDGRTTYKESIEDMATAYICEMKIISMHGPYTLLGGSMGGMIALEVAQQLKAQGHEIEKLILLDTFGPDINIQSYDKNHRTFFKNLQVSFFHRRKMLVNRVRKAVYSTIGLSVPLDIRLFETEMANFHALWKYKSKTYSGDVELIRAKRTATGWYSDPLMGWGKTVLGKIHTIEIEGNHNSFIESHDLGRNLKSLL